MSKDNRIGVVILNWNNWPETEECIESVLQSDYRHLSIFVVDNGSTDDSEAKLRKKFPKIHLIQTGQNFGYAGGNNFGIKRALEASVDTVLILNNDCRVDKSCVTKMVEVMKPAASVGMVSPKVYADKDIISHAGSDFDWRNNYVTSSRGAGQKDVGQFDELAEIETATGDCLLVSRELIEKIGLLDENYFLYYEDADWCLRARRNGFKIIYQPMAKAWHPGSLSTGGINKPVGAYYVLRNKLYFVQRYGPVLAKINNWIHFVLSLAKNMLLLVSNTGGRVARARLQALVDFVRGRRGQNPDITNL